MSSEPVLLSALALDGLVPVRQQGPAGVGVGGSVRLDGPDDRPMWLFGFGAAVVQGDTWSDAEIAWLEARTERRVLLRTEDAFRVEVGPPDTPMHWNAVHLEEITDRRLGTVALLLAQSAALERYERKADELVGEALTLLRGLRDGERLPWRTRPLNRRIAQISVAHLELASEFWLVDKPDATWDDPVSNRVYEELFDHLELDDRHAAVLHKLEPVGDNLRTVVELRQTAHALWLEIAIVLLIVVEVVLYF